jgi:hypothetical protein
MREGRGQAASAPMMVAKTANPATVANLPMSAPEIRKIGSRFPARRLRSPRDSFKHMGTTGKRAKATCGPREPSERPLRLRLRALSDWGRCSQAVREARRLDM